MKKRRTREEGKEERRGGEERGEEAGSTEVPEGGEGVIAEETDGPQCPAAGQG